jgi:hypothetical protein
MKKLALILLVIIFNGILNAVSSQVAPSNNSEGHWSRLPLMGKTFSERFGYEAPKPFGASLGLFVMSQEFTMDKVSIDGEPVDGDPTSIMGINVSVKD